MDIREFIRARAEEMKLLSTFDFFDPAPIGDALIEILEHHKQWVYALERPAQFETDYEAQSTSIDSYIMRASQEITFLVEEKYREVIGDTPPTTPVLRAIARIWKYHPDYQQEWA